MIRGRLQLGSDDLTVELASNDGYLLQHFVGTGIPILGSILRRTSLRLPNGAAYPHSSNSSGRKSQVGSQATTSARLWSWPTTCSRRCRISTTS